MNSTRRSAALVAVFALLLTLGLTAMPVRAEPGATAVMTQIQGVYKHRFANASADGTERWTSEDVVELVPMDAKHLYVRAELAFANGHSCSISGAAAFEDGAFLLREPEAQRMGPQACVLRLEVGAQELRLTDLDRSGTAATCRMYCGARGSLSDYRIARSARRDIRYLARLQASPQYQDALRSLGQTPSSRPVPTQP